MISLITYVIGFSSNNYDIQANLDDFLSYYGEYLSKRKERMFLYTGPPMCLEIMPWKDYETKIKPFSFPISFSYAYPADQDIKVGKKILIFVERVFQGNAEIGNISGPLFDRSMGKVLEGDVQISFGEKTFLVPKRWSNQYSKFLWWYIDPFIRKEILKENDEEGRIFLI